MKNNFGPKLFKNNLFLNNFGPKLQLRTTSLLMGISFVQSASVARGNLNFCADENSNIDIGTIKVLLLLFIILNAKI